MIRKYKVCSSCVMDTTDSSIVFDENDVCDHCNTFYNHTQPNWCADDSGFDEFNAVIKSIKLDGEGKDGHPELEDE